MTSSLIYKFCPPGDHPLKNLESGVLFCRHYADFNDPFEFWTRVVGDVPDQRAEPDRFRQAVRAWGFDPTDLDYDTSEFFQSLAEAEPPFDAIFDHTRIACFASEPDNLLMWSH